MAIIEYSTDTNNGSTSFDIELEDDVYNLVLEMAAKDGITIEEYILNLLTDFFKGKGNELENI